MKNIRKHRFGTLVLSFALCGVGVAQAAAAQEPAAAEPAFATVAGTVITRSEYANALNSAARAKFYHGKPPQNAVALLQREVADKLVARVLLLREAKRLGLAPDGAEIEHAVQVYEQRYAKSERWQQNRARMLPGLIERLEQDDVLARLEKAVRSRVRPDTAAAEAYYRGHPEKFTEPERLRVSLILLKVDPSAPAQAWTGADEEARAIVKRLRDGADMGELARLHSGDRSAQQGGDMGYLHAGMLPGGADEVLKTMQTGQTSDPLRVLEGIAILRLTDRKLARLVTFETARARAEELQLVERKDAQWAGFIAELKQAAPAQIDESLFFPLAGAADAQGSGK